MNTRRIGFWVTAIGILCFILGIYGRMGPAPYAVVIGLVAILAGAIVVMIAHPRPTRCFPHAATLVLIAIAIVLHGWCSCPSRPRWRG